MVKKNILSLLIACVILFLSFARSETFSGVNVLGLKHLDKAVHLSMYFAFMLVLLYENRSRIKNTLSLLILGIIPLIFGVAIEFFQSWLTVTRTGDVFDALFNFFGILVAVILWLLLQHFTKPAN